MALQTDTEVFSPQYGQIFTVQEIIDRTWEYWEGVAQRMICDGRLDFDDIDPISLWLNDFLPVMTVADVQWLIGDPGAKLLRQVLVSYC